MNIHKNKGTSIRSTLVLGVALAALAQFGVSAAGKAADPTGVSTGGTGGGAGGGGGGGGGSKTKVTTVPAPGAVVHTLVFAPAVSLYGVIPQCTGTIAVDPYYPSLSRFTLNLSASSLDLPPFTPLNVTVNGTGLYGGTFGWSFTGPSNVGSWTTFCVPGVVVTGVVVTDVAGNVIFSGQ